jgi:hypothetical protein
MMSRPRWIAKLSCRLKELGVGPASLVDPLSEHNFLKWPRDDHGPVMAEVHSKAAAGSPPRAVTPFPWVPFGRT